jgi:LacI family transcriptional regulator
MKKIPVVVLVLEFSSHYHREVYRGVANYARNNPRAFRPILVPDRQSLQLMRPPPDGIITHVTTATQREFFQRTLSPSVPMVNISGRLDELQLPTVRLDDLAAGRMAAGHLLACGLRQFGYFGRTIGAIFARRGEGFARSIRQAGHPCSIYLCPGGVISEQANHLEFRRLQKWLDALPKPVGILSGTDWVAIDIYEACDRLRLQIGQQIAVVGIDNDDILCETQTPSLSSVDIKADRIGYEAATLLVRLMRGKKAPPGPILVPPVRVVQRRSSDMLALSDPEVGSVLRFIRDHIDQPFSVEDAIRQVPLSRRALERRFRRSAGCSILDEVHRIKIERMRELLITTNQTIEEISVACGFVQLSHMAKLFRKKTGLPPGTFRKQFGDKQTAH